jgi:Arc/MetJ-type ribon-helix-helix transcriptional regulator
MERSAVKKTISLPADLARDAEEIAKAEGKSLSAVVQEALRAARSKRAMAEFRDLQTYWSRRAREKGIFSQKDLDRLLGK